MVSVGMSASNKPLLRSHRLRAGEHGWRWAGLLCALVALVLTAAYWETVDSMIHTWTGDTSYNHAFLIAPISLWLVWERRHILAKMSPRPAVSALAVVLTGAFVWWVGDIATTQFVKQVAYITVLIGAIVAIIGWMAARYLMLPLLYLFLMVPFGDFLVFPLQMFTAEFTVTLIQLVGIPVYMDGVFISIPTGDFHVARECAGLRFIIATLALTFLFMNLAYKSWRRRLLFLALAFIIPVIANGLRAFGIIMLAYYSNNEIAVGVDHIIYGWVFFSLVTIILLALGLSFSDRDIRGVPDFYVPAELGRMPSPGLTRLFGVSVAVLVVGAGIPAFAGLATNQLANGIHRIPEPKIGTPWQPRQILGESDWQPQFKGVDDEYLRHYRNGDMKVDLYVGYYALQREGAELIAFSNRVAREDAWRWAEIGTTSVVIGGKKINAITTRLASVRENRLVWHWYWVGGVLTSNPYLAKLHYIRSRIFGGPQGAAIVALSAPFLADIRTAQSSLNNFVARYTSFDGFNGGGLDP